VGAAGAIITPGIGTYATILLHLSRDETANGWSLPGIVTAIIHSTRIAEIGIGLIIIMPACILLVRERRRATTEMSDQTILSVLVILSLILSPITWSHYFVLALFPLLCICNPLPSVGLLAASSWFLETPDQIHLTALVPAILITTAVTLLMQRTLHHDHTSPLPLNQQVAHSTRSSGTVGTTITRVRLRVNAVSTQLRFRTYELTLGIPLAIALSIVEPNAIDAILVQLFSLAYVIRTISERSHPLASHASVLTQNR
jgi:hypothetical protein